MNGQAPRARAIATGALLGDPPPGRTPWAAPHDPNEVPRTGLSAVTATQDRRVDFLSIDQIRPGEPDKGPEGPLPDAPALAPNRGDMTASEPRKPADAGFEGGAELGSDLSPAIHAKAENMDGSIHDKGVVHTDTLRPVQAIDLAESLAPIPTEPPLTEWMAPGDLLIEAAYQRDLSPKSMDLIIQAGDVEKEAKLDAKTHCIPAWEAMGRIWFRKCRKTRRAA